jgi:pimeloyl-ACP methyl ester carboxylesterase
MSIRFIAVCATTLTVTAVAALAPAARDSGRVMEQTSIGPDALPDVFAELPGRRLLYRDAGGSGVPVVFLHAGTGSRLVWQHQIPAVRAAGYRFVAYDRLGSGGSVLESRADPGSAADDLQALMEHLKIDRFHLVGTAAGGIVAIDYALSFPRRLRSLAVANSVGGVQDEDYLAMGRRLRPSPQFDSMPAEFRELGPSYRAANPAGTARWMALEHESRAAVPLPSPQKSRNHVTFAMLERITVPTLLLTGDADLYTPPAVLRLFAARMPGARTVVVPEAGHSVYWEQPEIFNREVLAFIANHQ